MTDNEIKLKEHEERLKRLENKVFGQWMDQYEPEYDISEEPEPWVPTQGASIEMVQKAQEAHKVWDDRQRLKQFNGVYKVQ